MCSITGKPVIEKTSCAPSVKLLGFTRILTLVREWSLLRSLGIEQNDDQLYSLLVVKLEGNKVLLVCPSVPFEDQR